MNYYPVNHRGFVGAILIAAAFSVGCEGSLRAGPPTPLLITEKENPEVIWITRMVTTPEGKTYHGLFACYRRPVSMPGAPRCYLAEYSWRHDDLEWPGAVPLQDRVLAEPMPVNSASSPRAAPMQPSSSAPPPPTSGGCVQNGDCKGNRVCSNGVCVPSRAIRPAESD